METKTILARKFLYHSDVACLSVTDCARIIEERFQYNDELTLIDALKEEKVSDLCTELGAFKYLLSLEAAKLVPEHSFFLSPTHAGEKETKNIYQNIINEYRKIGLSLDEYPEIEMVDAFPHPYENVKGVALAPDGTDRDRYGIPFSIYIRRDAVDPTILPVIISHELVHYFIEDEGLLARGLEEGLADFFAFFVIAPKLMPKHVVEKYFISKRLNPNAASPRFKTYMDYVRACLYLYTFNGLQELTQLLKDGRQAIKNREIEIANGKDRPSIGRIQASKTVEKSILDFSWSTINNYPNFELVGARAYLYIKNHSNSMIVDAMSDVREHVLKEIENDIFGCVVNEKGAIEFEDFQTLKRSRALRFELRLA